MSCYAEEVVFEDADSQPQTAGREEMRKNYGELFASAPSLHAEIASRTRVGCHAVDEERVSGSPGGDIHAVAIYRLDDQG